MSIGNSKKIAFIGCSHFAANEVECQGYNNWSYQLYQKYPHHQYRNYSGGGKGIEYFQLALLDAKKWGADIVFINRTYCGRWLLLAESSNLDSVDFYFEVFNSKSNWEELRLRSQTLWGNVHQFTSNVGENRILPWIRKSTKILTLLFTNHVAATETRRQWEWEWYSNVTELYNFEHIFLIDWSISSHTKILDTGGEGEHLKSSNVNDLAVVEWMCKTFNSTGETLGDNPLWKCGITISYDDNHLTHYGNNVLLEQYILANDNVRKALTE